MNVNHAVRVSSRIRPRLLASLVGGGLLSHFGRRRQARAADRPNIIVCVMDDMRAGDWEALPQTTARLGSEGTTFPNFFLTTPLCSPSRASLLTGQYPHTHGVEGNSGADGGWHVYQAHGLDERSIAELLRQAGYRTALIGKLLNGTPGEGSVGAGWDEWYVPAPKYRDFSVNDNGERRKVNSYEADAMRTEALAFLEQTPVEQPFLLWFAPNACHTPALPPRQLRNRFKGKRVPRTAAFNEKGIGDKPRYIRKLKRMDKKTIKGQDDYLRRRMRTLLAVDLTIAALCDSLAATERLENTYIFVLTDNGYLLGEHRFTGKTVPYDHAIRVPLVAYGPGFTANTVDERLVANIDIAPTIAAVTGVTLDAPDGRSLIDDYDRDDLLIEWTGQSMASDGGPSPRAATRYQALRTRGHLYVDYTSGEREMFDYAVDPYESANLLATWGGHKPTSEAEELASQFAARLDQLRNCSGATCA